ncbi:MULTISPECIES: His-Xaa-Ser repeat protein HxsA [Mesorhizobium]|uniref:His-Xaa-Ser repeat protein HxsA n=1 Tax=Mesorhizobium TaxID=68287 RepID=UPI0010A979CB|nr:MULTISPECIES: His-Xaa-Ser repeat protein HxsA [Mesorhizobium]
MRKRLFTIPSLLAAGFMPIESTAMPIAPFNDGGKSKSLFDIFKLDHKFTLAGHRSHSSHSSHSSHRSSTGGGTYYPPAAPVYQAPAPVYQPPSPIYQAPTATAPAAAPLIVLPGNAAKFKEIVLQVQFAMLSFGYYNGELDGKMSPAMRSGLLKMQSDYNLKVTGTITPETLNALRITAD